MLLASVEALTEDGWAVTVVAGGDGPLLPLLRATGAEVLVRPIPVVRKANLSPRGLGRLVADHATSTRPMRRLVAEVDPDVIYVNTVTQPWWSAIARSTRVPSVVHVHEAERAVPRPLLAALLAPLALATEVIFNSETSRAVAEGVPALRRAPAHVVHNGVPAPARVVPPRESVTDGPRLLYVGRLSPRKGVDLTVEALAIVRRSGLPATLDLVGDVFEGYEWYEEELRQQVARHGLTDAVRFRGFQQDVAAVREGCDIALVPSRGDESFGNVVIESVLSARPCIVADHSGLAEASAGLGSVTRVRPDDPSALAAQILSDVQRWSAVRRLALDDAPRAGERYAPSAYRRRIGDILAGLADRRVTRS